MSFLLAFLAFCALIVLHEAGHFVAAKATGMRVERFFLFFPPKLVSFKRGDTIRCWVATCASRRQRCSGLVSYTAVPPASV